MASVVTGRVSIIIVTCNSLPSVSDSLESLEAAVKNIDCELIVVDNASADGSAGVVRENFGHATVIQNGRNVGFAAACNIGADRASGEYLLFHNPDLQIDADAISNLLNAYAKREKVGAVAGRMRFPDGSFQPTCRNFPTLRNMFFSRGSALSRLVPRGEVYTLPDCEETTEVPAVAGTFMMTKAHLFRSMGGFDRRFFMYMEDTDLCLRLARAGYRNYFVPSAGGVHLWGKGSQAGRFRRSCHHHLSVWKYFLKHHPNGFSLFVLPMVLLVNLVLRALLPKES